MAAFLRVSVRAKIPPSSAAAAEALLEELLELGVEDGVDDGVEGTVDVAQPGDGAHQGGRDVAGQAHGSRGVDHEERRPAEQEAACGEDTGKGNQSPCVFCFFFKSLPHTSRRF